MMGIRIILVNAKCGINNNRERHAAVKQLQSSLMAHLQNPPPHSVRVTIAIAFGYV